MPSRAVLGGSVPSKAVPCGPVLFTAPLSITAFNEAVMSEALMSGFMPCEAVAGKTMPYQAAPPRVT